MRKKVFRCRSALDDITDVFIAGVTEMIRRSASA